jgi:hypothetical protein
MSARFLRPVEVFALACSLAACGSSGSAGAFDPVGRPQSAAPSSDAGEPAAAPPATMTTRQIDSRVLARYREYQRVYKQVYETNDPTPLTSVAVDPLLTIVTKDVQKTAAKGEVWRFTNLLNPKIQGRSKDDSIVVVLDCVRTLDAYRYSATSGKRISAFRGGTFLYQAVMKFADGTWKISEARRGKKC